MKSNILLALSLLSICALATSQSHNYFFGHRGPYDVLLNQTVIIKSSSFLQVKTATLKYPLNGQRGRNVTAIEIYDRFTNDKGGHASITGGGIGFNHTKIQLKSQRGNGMNFQVLIFGR